MTEKNMRKRVRSRTHPWHDTAQNFECPSSDCTLPFILVWKDSVTLKYNTAGQPALARILNEPLRLTRADTSIRSMYAIYTGCFRSLHCSWSWRSDEIILADWSHWHELTLKSWVHFLIKPPEGCANKSFSNDAFSKIYPSVIIAMISISLILIQGKSFRVSLPRKDLFLHEISTRENACGREGFPLPFS